MNTPYTSIGQSLANLEKNLKDVLTTTTSARHPFIEELNSVVQQIIKSIDRPKKKLAEIREQHPDYLSRDPIKERIADLFEGRVGEPYTEEQKDELYKVAEERIQQQIPPGYKDAKKEAPEKYGDIIIWFQMLDFAEVQKTPIIFVTDDQKEDWWLKQNGRVLGPRTQLIEEMLQRSDMFFHMYRPDQFMQYAERNLAVAASPRAIEEIREVSTQAAASFAVPKVSIHYPKLFTDISPDTLALLKERVKEFELARARLGFNSESLSQAMRAYDTLRSHLSLPMYETDQDESDNEGDETQPDSEEND